MAKSIQIKYGNFIYFISITTNIGHYFITFISLCRFSMPVALHTATLRCSPPLSHKHILCITPKLVLSLHLLRYNIISIYYSYALRHIKLLYGHKIADIGNILIYFTYLNASSRHTLHILACFNTITSAFSIFQEVI